MIPDHLKPLYLGNVSGAIYSHGGIIIGEVYLAFESWQVLRYPLRRWTGVKNVSISAINLANYSAATIAPKA